MQIQSKLSIPCAQKSKQTLWNIKGFRDGLSYSTTRKSKETRVNAITQPQSHPTLKSTFFNRMGLFSRGGVWLAIPKLFCGENLLLYSHNVAPPIWNQIQLYSSHCCKNKKRWCNAFETTSIYWWFSTHAAFSAVSLERCQLVLISS